LVELLEQALVRGARGFEIFFAVAEPFAELEDALVAFFKVGLEAGEVGGVGLFAWERGRRDVVAECAGEALTQRAVLGGEGLGLVAQGGVLGLERGGARAWWAGSELAGVVGDCPFDRGSMVGRDEAAAGAGEACDRGDRERAPVRRSCVIAAVTSWCLCSVAERRARWAASMRPGVMASAAG
jgi:hypothetical protein